MRRPAFPQAARSHAHGGLHQPGNIMGTASHARVTFRAAVSRFSHVPIHRMCRKPANPVLSRAAIMQVDAFTGWLFVANVVMKAPRMTDPSA